MNAVRLFKKNIRFTIKIALGCLLLPLITIACDNSPADLSNPTENIQSGLKDIPSLVASDVEAKTIRIEMVPKSFSALAEMAGPAVVNIRIVTTAKGAGRTFKDVPREPFGEDDRMKEFYAPRILR